MTDTDNGVLNLADFEQLEAPAEGEAIEAQEEATEEADETGENGTGDNDEGQEQSEPKSKGKSVQARFDEMTAARRAAERRAEDAERKAQALESRMEQLEGRLPKEEAPKASEGPKAEDYDLGDLDPRYISDLIDWKADQKVEARLKEFRQSSDQEREAIAMQATFQERVSGASERYPDFQDIVTEGAARGEWPCTEAMGMGILNSEVGPDIAYHLAANKADAVRISNLHPLDQAREIGRLEAKFLNPPAPVVRATNTPPPPQNRARGAGGQYATSADALYEKALQEMT